MKRQEDRQIRIRRQIKFLEKELENIKNCPVSIPFNSGNAAIIIDKICKLKNGLRYN